MNAFSNEEGRVVHPLFRTQIKDNTKPTTTIPTSVATPSQLDDTLASDLQKPKMDVDNLSKTSKKKVKEKKKSVKQDRVEREGDKSERKKG